MSARACSILVLNYNGRKLLEKNLPSVVEAGQSAQCEIVVVDNRSDDDSVEFLKLKHPQVKVIALDKNYGYGEGNNRAAKKVTSDVIILLNNDVLPEKDAFKRLLIHFQDRDIFAVSCQQIVRTQAKMFIGGIAIGEFSRGLLRHRPKKTLDQSVIPQLYASGGAAAFDRQKFLQLGGFDQLYAPFYWEDADLSTRAWAKGWPVLYDPKSVVEHRHESTIRRVYPLWYIKAIGDRNMFIFNWRHLNRRKYWMQHCFWLPFHILHRPVGFWLAAAKMSAVISRRLKDPYRIDLDKLLSIT